VVLPTLAAVVLVLVVVLGVVVVVIVLVVVVVLASCSYPCSCSCSCSWWLLVLLLLLLLLLMCLLLLSSLVDFTWPSRQYEAWIAWIALGPQGSRKHEHGPQGIMRPTKTAHECLLGFV
jgi:hypothetical protein